MTAVPLFLVAVERRPNRKVFGHNLGVAGKKFM